MNNISVVLEVYNEEERLESCLKSFRWADELVVFVKKSTDNTLKIAKEYATHVYGVDYCNGSENILNNFKLHNFKEWCFCITASSLIDEELVTQLLKLTSDKNFKFDVIGLPYEINVFNLVGQFSPWYNEYKFPLINKKALKLSTILHQEISFKEGSRVYIINSNFTTGRFKHITHLNPNNFFIKHNRYVAYEASYFLNTYGHKSYFFALKKLLRSIAFVTIKRRTIFKGKNGFTLSLAYISYFIMLLVYVWYDSDNKMSNKLDE